MAKPTHAKSAAAPIDLPCAAEDVSLQMTRWLSHLRAERLFEVYKTAHPRA